MSEETEKLRDRLLIGLQAMATGCSVPMTLWDTFSNDVLAAADELSRLQSLSDQNRLTGGWRDIESAPKDGTPILAWCVHPHARHATDDKDWSAAVITQWINHNGGGWTWNGLGGSFTHWQPLPSPPPPLPGGEEKR